MPQARIISEAASLPKAASFARQGKHHSKTRDLVDKSRVFDGGGGGSRTRVRKTFLTTFYERSSLFDLTLSGGKEHPPVKASSVAVAGYGTLCPLTFTAA